MAGQLIAVSLFISIAAAPQADGLKGGPLRQDEGVAEEARGSAQVLEPNLEAVESGVKALRAGARTGGTWGLVQNLISAGIATGLAVWIGTTDIFVPDDGTGQNDLIKPLIVAGLAIAAATQVADGLYDVLARPATVESADDLLADPAALEASGLFFLRDRALDGRDSRIRSGIAETTSALGTGISAAILFTSDIDVAGKKILAGISAGIAGIQLITGILKFFRRSIAEKIYDSVMETAERPVMETEEPGGPSLRGTIYPDRDGRAAFGLSLGGRF